jgi:hypothetical protein
MKKLTKKHIQNEFRTLDPTRTFRVAKMAPIFPEKFNKLNMSENLKTTEKVIVSFHIGRGGRFNNAGFKRYLGEKNIGEIINIYDDSRPMFYYDRDKNGRFCKPYYADWNGNHLIDERDVETGVGELNFDNDYDRFISKFIEDCIDSEIELIIESNEWKSSNLETFLENL